MDKLRYVFDAVTDPPSPERPRAADRLFRQPWTLACYMVEGGGSDDYAWSRR